MEIFRDIGLLENTHDFSISTWNDLLLNSLSNLTGTTLQSGDKQSLVSALSDIVGTKADFAMQVLSEVGLLSSADASQSGEPPITVHSQTAVEHFAHLLSGQLAYRAAERDMVVLSHEIVTRPRDAEMVNRQHEMVYTSSLVVTGTPTTGEGAMSRTVGLPLAFATLEVLDRKVQSRGVLGGKEVWRAVLHGMEHVGIHMQERVSPPSFHNDLQSRTVETQLLLNRKQF